MNLQYAFLLTFIAGGISVWLMLRMSRQVRIRRINLIRQQVSEHGGEVLSVELSDRQHCPLSSEYHDPDLSYKFYDIRYRINGELKQGWAILEMKQNWYGPGSAIKENWLWFLA